MAIKRRSFAVRLASTAMAGSVAGPVASTVVSCGEGDESRIGEGMGPDIAQVMRAYFGDGLTSGRLVGTRYRRRFGSDDAWAEDLGPIVDIIDAQPTVDEAVAALRAAVEADAQAARMLLVDGWALATAEARIAALAEYVEA